MIGQSTASLEPRPRRWIQRLWGVPDINVRQKWRALWPHLRSLRHGGLRLLDAGCGTGQWALELAARRPNWVITGLDRDSFAIQRAETSRSRLALANVTFRVGDFLTFSSTVPFDVVLSVCSAHYLASQNRCIDIFHRFRSWVGPAGELLMLAPRQQAGVPFAFALPHPDWHDVFSEADIMSYCLDSGWTVRSLETCTHRCGCFVKQLDMAYPGVAGQALYPLKWLLACMDSRAGQHPERPSLMWVLRACASQRAPDSTKMFAP